MQSLNLTPTLSRYNPIIGWMFMGTETALTATGQPTIR